VTLGLATYRTAMSLAGTVLGGVFARRPTRADDVLRAGFLGETPEALRAAGSTWVHAASLGEMGMGVTWIEALAARGAKTPVHVTTRTAAGLVRAVRSLGPLAAASIAPHDVPRIVAARFDAARPTRLDLVETELWPNLMLEARRREIPILLVSATVTARSARRLRFLGLAGPALFGEGVYALPQSETHARRFESLGISPERIHVMGDLKARPLDPGAESLRPFVSRPALVFGSLRPGEETLARRLAELLESRRDASGDGGARRSIGPAFEGRSRAILVIAPRHPEGVARVRAAFRATPFQLLARDEGDRASATVDDWIEDASRRPGPRVALLNTRGELAAAYDGAWGAVVGGTFAPYGGHNVWEPAARGCPVLVGPHRDEIVAAVEAVARTGGGAVAEDAGEALQVVDRWLSDPDLAEMGGKSKLAAARAEGAAERGLRALSDWKLAP
jgi:3-deoxy-D-manno-octulosonic-acid transferase